MRNAKTQAMRILEGNHIPYELVAYDVAGHLPAEEVAAAIGFPPEQTFKTLVLLIERRGGSSSRASRPQPVLVLVPSTTQVDARKVAAALGEKKVQMAAQKDAERLTGLKKGGISPLALMDKGWPVIVDEAATLFDRIELSAGEVGLGLIVAVEPLLEVLHALSADVTAICG